MPDPEAAYVTLILPHKLAMNLNYLRRRTLASDVVVVLATLWRLMTPTSSVVRPQQPSNKTKRAA